MTHLSLLLQAEHVVQPLCVGLEAERIALREASDLGLGQPLHKLHVLAPGLVEAGALAEGLELDGAGGGEGVLQLEVADRHSLHGLVRLHEQLADLLEDARLHRQKVPTKRDLLRTSVLRSVTCKQRVL